MRLVTGTCVMLLSVLNAIALSETTLAPIQLNDQQYERPMLAVYTTFRGGTTYCGIHAALFTDGRLIWTNGYRSFVGPEIIQPEEFDLATTYRVQTARVDAQEVEAVIQQVLEHKDPQLYASAPFPLMLHMPYQRIYFNSEGSAILLSSSHETGSGYENINKLLNPEATPTPLTPEQEVFIADWSVVKEVLFDLVEAHEAEGVESDPLRFIELAVSDSETTGTAKTRLRL